MNDTEIEEMIVAAGKTSPRITPQAIDNAIDSRAGPQYHVFPGTTVTVCCVPLVNGYQVVGHSAAVSPDNFDEQIGRDVALQHAKDQMWSLLGYALRERLLNQSARKDYGA